MAGPTDHDPGLPAYSRRHQDRAQALAYRGKFERSVLRRLSHRRELWCVRRAVTMALGNGEQARAGRAPVILDLPCGAGRFAPLLSGCAGVYLPADYSPAMLALCRAALGAVGRQAKAPGLVVADARYLPFADRSVDLACCLRLLHHLPHPAQRAAVLRGLRRVSRGPVIVTFLDADCAKQRLHRLKARWSGRPSRRTLLTRAALAAEADAAGLMLHAVWRVSGWFSGQSIALLVPVPA